MSRRAILSLALLLVAAPLAAQSPFSDAKPHSEKAKPAVAYLFPEQISVAAGKSTQVELHFKVADGLHINSHSPHEKELIPTTLNLPEASGVRLADATFPPGVDFAFPLDPGEKLSVYTGEFSIRAQFIAQRGEHLVQGTLHYQACNNEQCMPPHSIPVAIDVIAQ